MAKSAPRRVRGLMMAIVLLAASACASGIPPTSSPSTEDVVAELQALGLTSDEAIAYLRERAADEGTLVLYGSAGTTDLLEALAQAFTAEYPEVGLEFVQLRSQEFVDRIDAELAEGRYAFDVVRANYALMARLIDDDLLVPVDGIPLDESLNPVFISRIAVTDRMSPAVIPWGPAQLASGPRPTEWDDFLLPEHSGCVLPDNVSWAVGLIEHRGEAGAEAWFEGFLANGGIMGGSIRAEQLRLISGEIDCLVYGTAAPVMTLAIEGAPIDFHVPEQAWSLDFASGVMRWTARPHAALLWLIWQTGPGAARIIAAEGDIPAFPGHRFDDDRRRLADWLDPASDATRRTLSLDLTTIRSEPKAAELMLRYHTANRVGADR
jgi:ABC-type Fe3+ transport system substrate-binding protein